MQKDDLINKDHSDAGLRTDRGQGQKQGDQLESYYNNWVKNHSG